MNITFTLTWPWLIVGLLYLAGLINTFLFTESMCNQLQRLLAILFWPFIPLILLVSALINMICG